MNVFQEAERRMARLEFLVEQICDKLGIPHKMVYDGSAIYTINRHTNGKAKIYTKDSTVAILCDKYAPITPDLSCGVRACYQTGDDVQHPLKPNTRYYIHIDMDGEATLNETVPAPRFL